MTSSGLTSLLGPILSVDAVKTYKPSPAVYALRPQSAGRPGWRFLLRLFERVGRHQRQIRGYLVAWCNRTANFPEEALGLRADGAESSPAWTSYRL